MITIFENYVTEDDFEVGDYVKFYPEYEHDKQRELVYVVTSIDSGIGSNYKYYIKMKSIYDDNAMKLSWIPPHTVRHLTKDEMIELDAKKYNI